MDMLFHLNQLTNQKVVDAEVEKAKVEVEKAEVEKAKVEVEKAKVEDVEEVEKAEVEVVEVKIDYRTKTLHKMSRTFGHPLP